MIKLTPREQEVMALVEQGLRYKVIGERLGISNQTVKIHLKNVRQKFGTSGDVKSTHARADYEARVRSAE